MFGVANYTATWLPFIATTFSKPTFNTTILLTGVKYKVCNQIKQLLQLRHFT